MKKEAKKSDETNNEVNDDINKVEVQGAIVAKHVSLAVTVLTIATRLPKGKEGVSRRDFARFFFFSGTANADANADDYKVGDRVRVTGQVQTSRKHPEQIVVGNTIAITQRVSEVEFGEGTDSGPFLPDENKASFRGEIMNVFAVKDKKVAVITLKTVLSNGYAHFPQIACFGRQYTEVLGAKKGAPVLVLAHIQTNNKEAENGEVRHYHSFVSDYIKI